MKKFMICFLCVLITITICACSMEDSNAKYQGTWVYEKYSNGSGEVEDILTINGTSANYTRKVTFMGAENTTTYANYVLETQGGKAVLNYIEGHGIKTKEWELTVTGDQLIAESSDDTIYFDKQ